MTELYQYNMLKITEKHIDIFKEISERFLCKTIVPEEDNWKSLTNNEIWQHILNQVIVVGGSAAADRLASDEELKNNISYEHIKELDENEAEQIINEMLQKIKARYASDITKCKKTRALIYNLKILMSFKQGPKCFIKRLSELRSKNIKEKYLMTNMSYIKRKGARDLLMGLGLEEYAIALDTRIINILRYVGIDIPDNFMSNYDEIEQEILENICKPIGLSGIQFDRMLYQNYDEIMKMKFK